MAKIHKHRTIRPSSRDAASTYKIDTEKVKVSDTLVVDIDHETLDFYQRFWFDGEVLSGKKSIHFKVDERNSELNINWQNITPRLIPKPTVIELKPEWFEMGYYVYVVAMNYNDENYFYVGMTGDRKYETARSPFYRMSGHFSMAKGSTQNQIIKALSKYWPDKDIQKLLLSMKISYYAYKMIDFEKDSITKHAQKRKFAEKVESCLIKILRKEFGLDHVVNKHQSSRSYEDVVNVGNQILKDLKKRVK